MITASKEFDEHLYEDEGSEFDQFKFEEFKAFCETKDYKFKEVIEEPSFSLFVSM